MRWTFAVAALLAATPAGAREVAVDSAVYLETAGANGALRVVPADRLQRGDRVVTILRWDAPPHHASYTAVSAVPAGLTIESASRSGVEVSTDGGRSWRRLDDPDAIPDGITHLRWRIDAGEGRLSYRAIVR